MFVAILFVTVLTGCSASLSTEAETPDQLRARLAEQQVQNAKLETELKDAKAAITKSDERAKKIALDVVERANAGNEEADESDAKPSKAKQRAPRFTRRPAVNPRVCGMTGRSVGYVFANLRAAKAAMKCEGSCYFLFNTSRSFMSVRVNHRAVTLCLDRRTPAPMPWTTRTTVDRKTVTERVSMAPPGYVVVIGHFVNESPSFQVELHTRVSDLQPFQAHSEQIYSQAFPVGRNGYKQRVVALWRPRSY
jgi:hypothetical protein